jgi:hypothetical protein
MHTVWLALALLMLPGPASVLRAGPDEGAESDDIPAVGRPADLPFSQASGWFEVRVHAEPTMLEAETPLTFTLTVRAIRPVRQPPQRLDLRELPAFAEAFYIEESSEEANRPDERTWEFVYRLKPRRTDVTEIPALPFVYFNPYLLTTSKGFQVIYTDPIALQVLPHEAVQIPVQAPESAFELAPGPSLLDRQTPWTPPRMALTLVLLVMPPILCALWYAGWRRRYPDAARQARQRRSRAARQALQQLHAARRLDAERRADRAANIVAGYLHERLDVPVAEPTPHEVAALFERQGRPPALTERTVRFFEACDRVRFLPAHKAERPDVLQSAAQLILAVEAETCPADPS